MTHPKNATSNLPGMPSSFRPVELSRLPSLPPVPREQLEQQLQELEAEIAPAPRLPQEAADDDS